MFKNEANSIQAMAISPGIAIGPVRLYGSTGYTKGEELAASEKIGAEQVETELRHLQQALAAAIDELKALSEHVARTVGRDEADIFEAQQLMLEDPDLLEEIQALITQHYFSASSALQQATERQAQELEELQNETLAARAADIRDVTVRTLRHLAGQGVINHARTNYETPVLIVAHDLTPSDTATLDPKMILGICTVVGGFTTHAAIIARSLEIPAIAGIDPHILSTLHDGQVVAIDGTRGLLYVHPYEEQQREFAASMRQQQEKRANLSVQNGARWRNHPATTSDGVAVPVFANVGDVQSASAAAEAGAEGIGLLRTEFLFGERPVFPDEKEQFESYVALFRAFVGTTSAGKPGKTIVARTLDAGADKPFPALELLIGRLQEANPALGLRGARIHLVHEELLRQQLRALLRAGTITGIHLHIMFPMITTMEEVRRLRAIYQLVRQELESERVALLPDTQIGIMVETPAAAFMAGALAREVDFFSIGANDLYQYTMATDRTNSRVTRMYSVLEPAVWRLIDHVVRAGRTNSKTVALCGELAADPRIGPLLAGLGVQELSMNPASIVRVKAALHEHTMEYWQQMATALLKAETATEMLDVMQG